MKTKAVKLVRDSSGSKFIVALERSMHTAMATTLSAHYIALGACIARGFAGVKAHAVPELLVLESIRAGNPRMEDLYCLRMRENGVDGSDAMPFLEDRRRTIMVAEQRVAFELNTTRREWKDIRLNQLRIADAQTIMAAFEQTGMFELAYKPEHLELARGHLEYVLKSNDGTVFDTLNYAEDIDVVHSDEGVRLLHIRNHRNQHNRELYAQAVVTSDFTFSVFTISPAAVKSIIGTTVPGVPKKAGVQRMPGMLPVADSGPELFAQRKFIHGVLVAEVEEGFTLSNDFNSPLCIVIEDSTRIQDVLSKYFQLVRRDKGVIVFAGTAKTGAPVYFQLLVQNNEAGFIDAVVDTADLNTPPPVRDVLIDDVLNLGADGDDEEADEEDEEEQDTSNIKRGSKPAPVQSKKLKDTMSPDEINRRFNRIYTEADLASASLNVLYRDLMVKLGLRESNLIIADGHITGASGAIGAHADILADEVFSEPDQTHDCLEDGIPFTAHYSSTTGMTEIVINANLIGGADDSEADEDLWCEEEMEVRSLRQYTTESLAAANQDEVYKDLAVKLDLPQSSLVYGIGRVMAGDENIITRIVCPQKNLEEYVSDRALNDFVHPCEVDGITFSIRPDSESDLAYVTVAPHGFTLTKTGLSANKSDESDSDDGEEDSDEYDEDKKPRHERAYVQNLNALHAELDWDMPAILDGKKLFLEVESGDVATHLLEKRGVTVWPSPKYSGLNKDVFDCTSADGIKFRVTIKGDEVKIKLRGKSKRHIA